MSTRWESPLGRASPRDASMLAAVLGSLQAQLADPALDAGAGTDVAELISAAVAELHRVAPPSRHEGGIAPVLGSGVLQELLRRQRSTPEKSEPEPVRTVDARL